MRLHDAETVVGKIWQFFAGFHRTGRVDNDEAEIISPELPSGQRTCELCESQRFGGTCSFISNHFKTPVRDHIDTRNASFPNASGHFGVGESRVQRFNRQMGMTSCQQVSAGSYARQRRLSCFMQKPSDMQHCRRSG